MSSIQQLEILSDKRVAGSCALESRAPTAYRTYTVFPWPPPGGGDVPRIIL